MVRYILGSLKSKRELAQQLQSPAALAEGTNLVLSTMWVPHEEWRQHADTVVYAHNSRTRKTRVFKASMNDKSKKALFSYFQNTHKNQYSIVLFLVLGIVVTKTKTKHVCE